MCSNVYISTRLMYVTHIYRRTGRIAAPQHRPNPFGICPKHLGHLPRDGGTATV